jgi:DNA-binding NtrC family response regulator
LTAAGDVDLDTLTRQHIVETYRRHDGNKARTARALGIGRRTLYRLLDKYGISDSEPEAAGTMPG